MSAQYNLICCRGVTTSASPFLPLLLQGTLLGSRLFLFGGEDVTRRPQATLYVLDLADMEWQTVEATGVHEQALFADRASCLQPLQRATHHLEFQGHPCPARTAEPCSFKKASATCGQCSSMTFHSACMFHAGSLTADAQLFQPDAAGHVQAAHISPQGSKP